MSCCTACCTCWCPVVPSDGLLCPDRFLHSQKCGVFAKTVPGLSCPCLSILDPIAEGGTRTLTALRPPDFETGASANSATSACPAPPD
jgi:hypothetical protein